MRHANFNAKLFLRETCGSPAQVHAFVASWKFAPPKLEAIKKWFTRGQISAEWLPVLLVLVELENGQAVSLARYVDMNGGRGNAAAA